MLAGSRTGAVPVGTADPLLPPTLLERPNGLFIQDKFVAFREQKDASLAARVLILPSHQVNIRARELPEPEADGTAYLKIPLNVLGDR